MRERSGAPYATRAAEPRTQHSTAALSLEATELLYIKSTSKEQTLILTRVVKGKYEFLRFSKDSTGKLRLPRTS